MNRRKQEDSTIEFGNYIKSCRMGKQWSILEVGEKIGVSANYVSLMERGMRIPTEETIEKLASLYNIEEDVLYRLLGKVPRNVLEEIKNNPKLQKAIAYTQKINLPIEQKKKMEEEVLRVYAEFLNIHKDEFKE